MLHRSGESLIDLDGMVTHYSDADRIAKQFEILKDFASMQFSRHVILPAKPDPTNAAKRSPRATILMFLSLNKNKRE